MATCPRCHGALSDNHRCPKGRFYWVPEALLTAAIGGSLGAGLCYFISERPANPLVLSYAALGSVLAIALKQALTLRRL